MEKEMSNNKVIAEFMNVPKFKKASSRKLLYNKSWDWLMPVIREVLMTIDIEDVFQQAMFDSDELKANILDCDIDGAYKEVVELIKQIKTYRDGEH
jgi:hypothetical protein